MTEAVQAYWPVVVGIVVALTGYIELRFRVANLEKSDITQDKDITKLNADLSSFNSEILKDMTEIKIALARIEETLKRHG